MAAEEAKDLSMKIKHNSRIKQEKMANNRRYGSGKKIFSNTCKETSNNLW